MEHARPKRHRVWIRLWTGIKNVMESLYFNATLKLIALRLLLIATLGNLCALIIRYPQVKDHDDSEEVIFSAAYLGFVVLHHALSAFKLAFIPRWLDLLVLFLELIFGLVALAYFPYYQNDELGIGTTISSITIIFLLFNLFVLRIAAIIRHKGKNLDRPFNLLEDRSRRKGVSESRLPVGFSLLLGRSLTSKQFLGEGIWVRLLRGIIAGGMMVAIIVYGLLSVAIQPFLESSSVPMKESRTMRYNYPEVGILELVFVDAPWKQAFEAGTWTFFFGTSLGSQSWQQSIEDKVHKAVNVSIVFKDGDGMIRQIRCGNIQPVIPGPDDPNTLQAQGYIDSFFMIGCPNLSPYGGYWPRSEVLISVDFGVLNPQTRLMGGTAPIAIYPSLTNLTDVSIRQVISDVAPLPLPPGGNYIVTMSVRGRTAYYSLRKQYLAILGFFDSPDVNYLIPHIQHAIPLMSSPSSSPNVSSVQLLCGFDTREFRFDVDRKEKSVISGFATIGGFWTAISAVFALIFGTTLLRIFFGARELAMFGLAQTWERDKIVTAYLDAYPQLREEISSTSSQRRGVVAVMQDHLLDMRLFKDVLEAEQQEQRKAETETTSSMLDEKNSQESNSEQVSEDSSLLLVDDPEKVAVCQASAEHHV